MLRTIALTSGESQEVKKGRTIRWLILKENWQKLWYRIVSLQ